MKKKTINFIVIFLLSITMTILLVACSSQNEDNGNDWWTTEGELIKDESGNVIFNNVSLRLETVVSGEDRDAFNDIISRFNRIYDQKIRINVTNTPAASFENSVAEKIVRNSNAPDLIMSHQKSHKNFADNKLIQPLNVVMDDSNILIDLDNYASGLAKYSSLGFEDYIFSIPIDGQSLVVFYNKKELEKTGKPLPTSREELMEISDIYKNMTGNTPISWATSGDYFSEYVYITAVMQNGAKLFNEESYKVDWYDNEDNRMAFKQANMSFRELFNAGYAKFNEASSTALNLFMSGNRLFYFAPPWQMGDLLTGYAFQEDITEEELIENYVGGTSMSGWFAMSDNDSKNVVYGDSHFFAMSKTVTDINKKAAILEFIKWFTEDANIGVQWAKAGHISMSNTIAYDDVYKNSLHVSEFIAKFYGNLNDFRSIGITPYYESVISNLKALFSDAVDNNSRTDEQENSIIKSKQNAVNNSIDFFG